MPKAATPRAPKAKAPAEHPTWIDASLASLVVPVASLKPDPKNARTHSKRNLASIRGSLSSFGQMLPLIVDDAGVVLVGNGRLSVILSEPLPTKPGGKDLVKWDRVAVLRFKGTTEQARALSLADNRAGELATWDYETLAGCGMPPCWSLHPRVFLALWRRFRGVVGF